MKNLPAVQETWVQSLGQKDTLEKGIAIYSSILAQRIPREHRSLVDYSPYSYKELDMMEAKKRLFM